MAQRQVTQESAKIMISYSQKDTDFVNRLYGGLTMGGISAEDIWIDWEGIQPSADWMAEITKGIQGADVFVFVISPNSINSEVCSREIQIAVDNNKKFVPLLYRKPAQESSMPEIVKAKQWIDFREQDDFEEAISVLIETIKNDLEWVAEHTRLLTKALEWQAEERNRSYLLRGEDLQKGEDYISLAATGKEPQPTPSQVEYVQASRRDDRRRRRNTLLSVISALIVVSVLAVVALILFNVAKNNQRIATYRFLNSEALILLEEDYDLAGSLALESLRLATNETLEGQTSRINDYRDVISTVSLVAASHPTLRKKLPSPHSGDITGIDYHPDGSQFASADSDGLLAVWDSDTYAIEWNIRLEGINDVAYHPGGKFLAVANRGVDIFDPETGESIGLLDIGWVSAIAFNHDGSLLAASGEDTRVYIWDTETWGLQMVTGGEPHGDLVSSILFSPDGKEIYSTSYNLAKWDIATGENTDLIYRAHEVVEENAYYNIASSFFNSSANQLVTIGGANLHFRDPVTMENTGREIQAKAPIQSMALSPDGTFVAAAMETPDLSILNLVNGTWEFRTGGHSAPLTKVAYSPDGQWILSGGQLGQLSVWVGNPSEYREKDGMVGWLFQTEDVVDMAYNNAGIIATGHSQGRVRLWEAKSGEFLGELDVEVPDRVNDIKFNPQGDVLAIGVSDENIALTLWNIETKTLVTEPIYHSGGVAELAFSQIGNLMASVPAWKHHIPLKIINYNSLERIQLSDSVPEGYGTSVTFSPDGETLLVGQNGEFLWSYGIESQDCCVYDFTNISETAEEIIITPDGNYLIAGYFNGEVILWSLNPESPKPIVLAAHADSITGLDINDDGTLLASSSEDGSVILVDLANAVENQASPGSNSPILADISLFNSGIAGISFVEGSNQVYTVDKEGRALIWNFDPESWPDIICNRISHNISQNVREFYKLGEYQDKCNNQPVTLNAEDLPESVFEATNILFSISSDLMKKSSTSGFPLSKGETLSQGKHFSDDFSNPNSGWIKGNSEVGSFQYASNETYHIRIDSSNIWDGVASPITAQENSLIEVDAELINGSPGYAVGVICAFEDWENFFRVYVNGSGYFSADRLDEGEWTLVYDWMYSEHIPLSGKTIHFHVECLSDSITLSINDAFIYEWTGLTLPPGQAGIFVETFEANSAEIEFDNFSVVVP